MLVVRSNVSYFIMVVPYLENRSVVILQLYVNNRIAIGRHEGSEIEPAGEPNGEVAAGAVEGPGHETGPESTQDVSRTQGYWFHSGTRTIYAARRKQGDSSVKGKGPS
jgi:hypothetical protein